MSNAAGYEVIDDIWGPDPAPTPKTSSQLETEVAYLTKLLDVERVSSGIQLLRTIKANLATVEHMYDLFVLTAEQVENALRRQLPHKPVTLP